MFNNFYIGYQQQERKFCNVYLNGQNDNTRVRIGLFTGISMRDVQLTLCEKWDLSSTNLRLFNQEGVELFQDDLIYIKGDQKLYASLSNYFHSLYGFQDNEEFDTATSFSEYEIVRVLGEGGFGQVLLGQHKVSQNKVAIKIVNTRMIGNAQDIDMVFREAELLKSLGHRNIVKIYSCYTLQNMQVVFIMEYLEGGELLEYVENQGTLTEEEARVFFIQIAEAMEYCHQRKLIHRDLKLENILLANKNQRLVKIVDFGIAGMALNMGVDKIDMGSLKYMAPETLSGKQNRIGPSIDVWAMGVILYTMLCGQLPFQGTTTPDVVKAILAAQYTFPSRLTLSQDIRDLLSRIFIPDTSKRIKLKDILQHDWIKQLAMSGPFGKGTSHLGQGQLDNKSKTHFYTNQFSDTGKKVRLGQVTSFNLQSGPTLIIGKKQSNLKREPTVLKNSLALPNIQTTQLPANQTIQIQIHPSVKEISPDDKANEQVIDKNKMLPQILTPQSSTDNELQRKPFKTPPKEKIIQSNRYVSKLNLNLPKMKSVNVSVASRNRVSSQYKDEKLEQWNRYIIQNHQFFRQFEQLQQLEKDKSRSLHIHRFSISQIE